MGSDPTRLTRGVGFVTGGAVQLVDLIASPLDVVGVPDAREVDLDVDPRARWRPRARSSRATRTSLDADGLPSSATTTACSVAAAHARITSSGVCVAPFSAS